MCRCLDSRHCRHPWQAYGLTEELGAWPLCNDASTIHLNKAPIAYFFSCRCLIAYCGHHWQAYALSEELGAWLLFDDANIKHIGAWPDVAASMVNGRHQPSLLLYERAD